MYSDKEEGFVADRAIGWQGGPQETIRYLAPLATDVLRSTCSMILPNNNDDDDDNDNETKQPQQQQQQDNGLVARVQEQTLLEFDGSALLTAENPIGPLYDVQAVLQPNTDDYYVKTIQRIEDCFSDEPGKSQRLFVLANPAWRNKNSFGYFGAAQRAQRQILDRYPVTFALDEFVVRGQRVGLLKVWPHGWGVYLASMPYERKDDKDGGRSESLNPKPLGTFSERPKYDDIDRLVLEALDSGSVG